MLVDACPVCRCDSAKANASVWRRESASGKGDGGRESGMGKVNLTHARHASPLGGRASTAAGPRATHPLSASAFILLERRLVV